MNLPTRPLPIESLEAKPFWDGCREGRLRMQYCASCDKLNWFPRSSCADCGAQEFNWKDVAGTGILETFSIVYRPMNAAWASEVPYVLAIVRLDEGPRMVTRIITKDGREPRMDARVRVHFVPASDDVQLPFFEEI